MIVKAKHQFSVERSPMIISKMHEYMYTPVLKVSVNVPSLKLFVVTPGRVPSC